MGKRSPRLQFTEEERASPELKKSIRKADKKADKLEKAEAKIPKKTVKRKERVVDADGKVTTRLYFEEVDKKKPPSKLSHAAETAPINSASTAVHRDSPRKIMSVWKVLTKSRKLPRAACGWLIPHIVPTSSSPIATQLTQKRRQIKPI